MSNMKGKIKMLDNIIQGLDYLNKITVFFAFVTMCIAIYSVWQNHKLNQSVAILLLRQGKKRHLVSMRRRMVTRAEVLAFLHSYDVNNQMSIAHTNTIDFFRDIEAVQMGKKSEIVIPVKDTDKLDIFQ